MIRWLRSALQSLRGHSRTQAAAVGPGPGKSRKPRYGATVVDVQDLGPHLRRVRFAGEALKAFAWSGPAAHIKLVLDPTGGPDGRPLMRTYTPRRFDAASGTLDVDFVLHDAGPASRWAAQAAAGQPMTIAGPGRGYAIDPAVSHYLLAGDASALPALATLLEALPPSAEVQVYVELDDPADQPALDAVHPRATLHWLPRRSDADPYPGWRIEQALRDVPLPPGDGRVYVACESDAVRRIRRQLLEERGLTPARLVTRGYWKRGRADHPDRDYGEDLPPAA